MKVRPAEDKDLESLLALSQAGFDYDYRFDTTLNMQWSSSAEAREYFSSCMKSKDSLALVAEDNGGVVAFLTASLITAESYRQNMRLAELQIMFVSEHLRSRGVGRALVAEFQQWAKENGSKRIKVVVSAGNVRAAEFYRDNSFQDYTLVLETEI